MGKKKETPEQKIGACVAELLREIAHWEAMKENGCNDPFWADGVNMNLTRNHVISYKRQILDLCEEIGYPLPQEYFLSTPPEVPNNYMASLRQKKRVARIQADGTIIVRKCPEYGDQLSMMLD